MLINSVQMATNMINIMWMYNLLWLMDILTDYSN